jgi:hypothetical protein
VEQADLASKIPGIRFQIPPILSDELLAVIQSLSTELIRGLSRELAGQVKGALQRAVLGQATPFSVSKQLETLIGPRGNVGAGASADRIVRTEVNRAFNAADEFVRSDLAEDVPTLKKIWVASNDGRTRAAHAFMHKKVVDADDAFEVPVVVTRGGAAVRVGTEDLNYPLDPKGSPGNTVNCRCNTITIPEDLLDEMLAQIPGRSKPI